MRMSDIIVILRGTPTRTSSEKTPGASAPTPTAQAGKQEDNMSNKDDMTPKNRPADKQIFTTKIYRPVQRKAFDYEAEERKHNQPAPPNAAQTTDPAPAQQPDSAAPNSSADPVPIEDMVWRDRGGFSGAGPGGNYTDIREQNLMQYEQKLRNTAVMLNDAQKELDRRESLLETWERNLKATEAALQKRAEALRTLEAQADERLRRTHQDADRILSQAQENARAERQAILEAQADQEVRLLVQTRLAGYFEENALREDALRRQLNAEHAHIAAEHTDLITQVDQQAQSIQLTLGKTVNEALSQIENARDQMMLELDKWRRQLYSAQYRDFASCFANLDKLVEGMEKRLAKELAEGSVGYHPELAEELKRYIKNMKTLRKTFERSLGNLGICAFYPEAGELFSSYFHTLADLDPEQETDEDFNDLPIVSCVKPGLVKINETGGEPLLLAVVTVDRTRA